MKTQYDHLIDMATYVQSMLKLKGVHCSINEVYLDLARFTMDKHIYLIPDRKTAESIFPKL